MAATGKFRLVMGVVVLLLLIAAIWSLYAVFIRAPMELAGATAAGVKEMFNFTPRVTVNQTVVIEQSAPIMEVATVARQVMVDHAWSHTWLGSTKSIRLIGTFTAKAGFDLKEPFTIAIEKGPLRVKASLPNPKLLSLTMDSYRIAADESGWWNRVTDADREAAVRDLQNAARSQAEASGILEEARTTAEQRIREIVERNGASVEFIAPAGL
jgi:hypothetical protein